MYGKRLQFLYTGPYEHVQYIRTFEVPRLSTFVFKKSSETKIFMIIIIRG